MEINIPTVSVSQINAYIKKQFDSDLTFASIAVTGEISNFSPHYRSGHLYLTLKDDRSAIKAVMFASDASRLSFRPENGMKVVAIGRISVFERDGVYQLYIRQMLPDGAGALAAAFRQLKERLRKKGLFDPAHKKPLPAFPKRIGVVTSPGAAALQDVLNVIRRRFPVAEVVFAGVTVQGASAPGEIVAALQEMNRRRAADVILLVRGGGSEEDLWCFNDEMLAHAIYDSEIPIVSGVGHETDFTICDFVSDLRAPTPSAAAEMATPDISELIQAADSLQHRLFFTVNALLSDKRSRLSSLLSRRTFSSPSGFFTEEQKRIEGLKSRAYACVARLSQTEARRFAPLPGALRHAAAAAINVRSAELQKDVAKLRSLNPLDVLLRGYAAVYRNGEILSDARSVAIGTDLTVRMHDGSLVCRVTGKGEIES